MRCIYFDIEACYTTNVLYFLYILRIILHADKLLYSLQNKHKQTYTTPQKLCNNILYTFLLKNFLTIKFKTKKKWYKFVWSMAYKIRGNIVKRKCFLRSTSILLIWYSIQKQKIVWFFSVWNGIIILIGIKVTFSDMYISFVSNACVNHDFLMKFYFN